MGKKKSGASYGSSSKSLQRSMVDVGVKSDNEADNLGDFVNLNGNITESSDDSDKDEVVFDLGANDDDSSDEDEDEDDNDDSDEKVCHFTNFLMISIISCLNRIESNYLYVSGIAFLYDGMK